MGALEEGRYSEEMMNNGCIDMGSDDEGDEEVTAIQEAVRVLLKGLGEDVNREGLRKTPLRVAKAFREGTRGFGFVQGKGPSLPRAAGNMRSNSRRSAQATKTKELEGRKLIF